MKKIAFLALASLFMSNSSWASSTTTKPIGHDILAICSNETGRVPLFEIVGQVKSFVGPRLMSLQAPVSIRNLATKAAFQGVVSLTKTTPYQYVLNGYSTKVVQGEETQTIHLFGSSFGRQLVLMKNTNGIDLKTYTCSLNEKLLEHP